MASIYQDHILDHFKHPRNTGALPDPDLEFSDENPLCGDTITITLEHDTKGKITMARHVTQGCAISQAGASMLFEQLEGKTIKEALALDKDAVLEEFGTELSVSRVKCALLALTALKKGIVEHETLQHAKGNREKTK